MSAAAAKRIRRCQGQASTTTNYAIHYQELGEGFRERTDPFCACSLTIYHGLWPIWADGCGYRRCKALPSLPGRGVLGGRCRHCPCFGFVEMTEEGETAKSFYNVMTNAGRRVRIRFFTLSQLVKPIRISILFGFKKFKIDPKWTIQNLRRMPPKDSFHNNGRGILKTF